MTRYRYTTLTSALDDQFSPLRTYFDERFNNLRPLQAEYRARSGHLLVDGGEANPGTLGTAFDLQVSFRLGSEATPPVVRAAVRSHPDEAAAIVEATRLAQDAAQGDIDFETLGRACWALALCAELVRNRRAVLQGSPLMPLIDGNRFEIGTILALAPEDGLRQLREFDAIANEKLFPQLDARLNLGPTFEGSTLCRADADIIANEALIDLKTHLGAKNARTGLRTDALSRIDLYQVLAYALFDRPDTYGITSIGIYSARYGNLVIWPLIGAMETMAGGSIDLGEERSRVWALLGG